MTPRRPPPSRVILFFFNDAATTEIYTLSLHDALPISLERIAAADSDARAAMGAAGREKVVAEFAIERTAEDLLTVFRDRKSTRLNSSHANISYAVFCLKKKTTSEPSAQSFYRKTIL